MKTGLVLDQKREGGEGMHFWEVYLYNVKSFIFLLFII